VLHIASSSSGPWLSSTGSAILAPVSGRIILVAKGINGMGLSSKGDAANVRELEAQMRQIGPLNGKVISAPTIDAWLRSAESQAKLEVGGQATRL
jgi:hypothetical protein